MEEGATEKEIELCLEEAYGLYPDASEDELWNIGAEIYEERLGGQYP